MTAYALGDICSRLRSGKGIPTARVKTTGVYPVIGGNGLRGYTDTFNFEGDCTIIGRQGAACGNVRFFSGKAYMTEHAVVVCANEKHDTHYLAYLLSTMGLGRLSAQSAQPGLSVKTLAKQIVNLPSLDVQKRTSELLGKLDHKIALNNQTNDYLAEMCEALAAAVEPDDEGVLGDISVQVTDKAACSESSLDSYVSTESLLSGKGGRQEAASLPATGKITVYRTGDTLISNIRPYFKKIWLADRDGTCSGDVIVFRAKEQRHAAYLYSVLRSNAFFEYVMAGAKGTKMPRGDKKLMMQYPVARVRDQGTLDALTVMVGQIGANSRENETLSSLGDALLPKLMSGEIDVSQIDLPTQPNNHLSFD